MRTHIQNIAIALVIIIIGGIAIYFYTTDSETTAENQGVSSMNTPEVQEAAKAPEAKVVTSLPETEFSIEIFTMGDPDAPVTMIEYSSLGCPHCKSFHENTLPILIKEYINTGKLKLVYRDFPLGARAMAAAMLTRCVPKQMYFGMIELLFENQVLWNKAEDAISALTSVAKHAMMTGDDVIACLQDEELMKGITAIADDGKTRYGIESTPTFLIGEDGGTIINGAEDISVFRKAIEDALN